jgi:hypothetical protein
MPPDRPEQARLPGDARLKTSPESAISKHKGDILARGMLEI